MIEELSTYVRRVIISLEGTLMMTLVTCLVIFAYLSNQRYFKEMTDQDVRGPECIVNNKTPLNKIYTFKFCK